MQNKKTKKRTTTSIYGPFLQKNVKNAWGRLSCSMVTEKVPAAKQEKRELQTLEQEQFVFPELRQEAPTEKTETDP
ncbi:MAG: hypothetical protein KKH60_07720 [Proteobacteria bacterium]|nr:hypothetical protein [Pseudomonadota bacterium]MBU1139550.1 hypothetical protein [Pseudomonadota bacterium]